MSSQVEKDVKKKQVEKLYMMGFSIVQIAQALNVNERTIIRYKNELYQEIKEKYKDKGLLINDILKQYERVLEEAWKNFERLDEIHKPSALSHINNSISKRAEMLSKLGFIETEPDKIKIETETRMNITDLIILAKKMENGKISN